MDTDSKQLRMDSLRDQIENIQEQIDAAEPSDYVSESEYDEAIDEEGDVTVYGIRFSPSRVLKEMDPTAYRCGFNDYCDSRDLEEFQEYRDMVEEMEDLQAELDDLEDEDED